MAKQKYAYRNGNNFGVPAQAAGERLARISRRHDDEYLLPAAVVEDAANPRSPLHAAFEWDDAIAAQAQREDRARELIRSIVTVRVEIIDDRPKEARQMTYVSIGEKKAGGAGYVEVTRAMADPEMRERVLADAVAGLKAWQRRYGHLEELAELVAAIEGVVGEAVPA